MAPTILTTFQVEAGELLERVEETILALESRPADAGLIDELFRAFHTLKGSAGVAGVPSIASFTHHVETAMDGVRAGRVPLTAALVTTILAAKDLVADLLLEATGGRPCDPAIGAALIAELAALVAAGGPAPAAPAAPPGPAEIVDYLITFQPDVELAELGVSPTEILDELRTLGRCEILGDPGAPSIDGRPPAWTVSLTTTHDHNAISDVFIFIQSQGTLTIDRGFSEFTDDEPVEASPVERPIEAAPADAPAARRGGGASSAETTVRVASERLDQLVKLVGELVITQSRLREVATSVSSHELAGPVEAMERLIGDVRDNVLGLRMVPIGTTFTRFHRLIRDLSGELGKDVELVTSGDETDLDKTVIDQLAEPLVHILRNSMDHGMETPHERVAAGKAARGTVRLSATHAGSYVVIAIADDGRGIDTAAVRRKAEAQGLVAPGEVLSEPDALALITRPGFSTAATVTQLSGRGVGMDVVKKAVERLRGTLAITSQLGVGTTIHLTLPLTLAIIDGLLVEIQRERFIVPMAAVIENLELTRAERWANNGRNVIAVRGELVPYVRLREVFAMAEADDPFEKIVVVAVDGQRVGLVVDRVVGLHQTVIEPLGRYYRDTALFSGTAIMGDGRVAMILDLASTVRLADRARIERPTAGARGS